MTSEISLPAQCDWRRAIAANQFLPIGAIEDLEAVTIGGIDQWISVRGTDPDNPLLLFLHGGPGYPMMAETWTWQRPWEDFFTVVQWDQRGGGKTYAANADKDVPISIADFQRDAEELIAYLLARYGKRKLILLGHSWGSALGLLVAQSRPDLLHAYIGVGQISDMIAGETASYRITLEKARADANAEAVAQLEAIAPYPTPETPTEHVFVERTWATHYGGMIHSMREDDEIERWRMSPYYSDEEVVATARGAMMTLNAIWPELRTLNFDAVRRVDCPFFLFAGTEDLATPTEIAKPLFDRVDAPHKRFFEYPGVAHYAFNEAPGRFLLDLVQHVRPVAEAAEA